jgi:hypothetical protein
MGKNYSKLPKTIGKKTIQNTLEKSIKSNLISKQIY